MKKLSENPSPNLAGTLSHPHLYVVDSTQLDSTSQSLGVLQDGSELLRLSCRVEYQPLVETSSEAPTSPSGQWIQITPAGLSATRDGRAFDFASLISIIANTELPMLVDWEHESELPEGSTRAAGWIEDLVADPQGDRFGVPGIYARVEWTPSGLRDVANLEYRFLSPVLLVSATDSQALSLVSVALTNTPALTMQSIDSVRARFSRAGRNFSTRERMVEDSLKALCKALEVEESADEVVILESAKLLKEQCSKLTDELQVATSEAATLKAELAEIKLQAFRSEVDQVLAQASRDGKVTPAQQGKYREFCSDRKSFELFRDTVLPSLPSLLGPAPKSIAPAEDDLPAAPYIEACRKAGLTDQQIKDALKLQKTTRGQRAANGEDY